MTQTPDGNVSGLLLGAHPPAQVSLLAEELKFLQKTELSKA